MKNNYFICWVFFINYKDIGILYLVFGIGVGLIGMVFSMFIWLEFFVLGVMLGDDYFYNVIVIVYVFIMIFFLVMLVMIGGFGNWLVLLYIGVLDMVFFWLNNISFWLLLFVLFLLLGFVFVE